MGEALKGAIPRQREMNLSRLAHLVELLSWAKKFAPQLRLE
jgi:hypothetical protein